MTRIPETRGRPKDPFLDGYDDSELRIVSEFLSNWLPFLSEGLCSHCSILLSHRIHSLSPELNDRKDPSNSGENFSPSTPSIVDKDVENCDTHSLGYWKDEVETIPLSSRKYERNDWSDSPLAYASVTCSREVDKVGPIPSRSCNYEFNGWSYPPVAYASCTYSREADKVGPIPSRSTNYESNGWSDSPVAYASATHSREVDKVGPIPSRSCNCDGWSYPPVAYASSTYSREADKVGPIPSRSTNHESNGWSDSPVAYASATHSGEVDKVGPIPLRTCNYESNGRSDPPVAYASATHSREAVKVGPIESKSPSPRVHLQWGDMVPEEHIEAVPPSSCKDEWNGWSDPPDAYASISYSREVDKVGPIENKSPSMRTLLTCEDIVPEEHEEAEEDNKESEQYNNATVMNGESSEAVKTKTELSRDQREYIRFTNVKRKKDFICLERINGKLTNILKGLELHTGVFSVVEQMRIIDYVYELEKQGRRGDLKERTFTEPRKWMPGKGRITIQFGCCYNYAVDKNGNPPGILKNEEVDPLPSLFKVIIKRLIRWHVLPPSCVPDSCIVNIYEKGDCIPPHIDNHDFVRPFCTISFLSECNIVFGTDLKIEGPGNFSGSIAIPLPVGSVLVLDGNGADVAKHCVPAVPTKRISLTFRKMDETKHPYFYTPNRDLQGLEPLCYEDKKPKKSPTKRNMNRPAMGGRFRSDEEARYPARNQGTKTGRRTRVVLGRK